MSARPRSAMLAALRPPRTFDRQGRIELLDEVAQALRDGKMPNDEARLFLAGALLAWLENGGDLAKDYFRVTRPQSHRTVQVVWRELEDERLEGLIADEGRAARARRIITPTASDEAMK